LAGVRAAAKRLQDRPPDYYADSDFVEEGGTPVLKRTRTAALVVAAALGLTACSAQNKDVVRSGLAALPGTDPGLAHVHGLGVDPGDGMLFAASHLGVFRVPTSGNAVRIANRYQDTMGFTVIGPHHFLGSGHPDLREDLPSYLGLIESTDGGQTWQSLSLSGQADFHALRVAGDRTYGYDATTGELLTSTNRHAWDRLAKIELSDLAVSPANPQLLLATTPRGIQRSIDGGSTFSPVRNVPVLQNLAWATPKALYGVAPDGAVWASADAGIRWTTRSRLDGAPQAMTAVGDATVYVATDSGIYASFDAAATFTLRYPFG
jgi:hypothetical protein